MNFAEFFKFFRAALLIALSLVFVFLFVNVQSVDVDSNRRIVENLQQLERLDADADNSILKLRYLLYGNYDGIVAILEQIKQHKLVLEQGKDAIAGRGDKVIDARLKALSKTFEEKESRIEHFKSYNAILKNSFRYFPKSIDELEHQVQSDRVLSHNLEHLLVEVMLLHMGSSKDYQMIRQQLAQLESARSGLPKSLYPKLDAVLKHGYHILEYEEKVDDAMGKILGLDYRHALNSLNAAYKESFDNSLLRANLSRQLLVLLSLALLLYASYSFLRLRKTAESLKLASLVYQASSEAMMVSDANNAIISVNPAFTKITGYTENEVKGKNPKLLSSGRHDKDFYRSMWETINSSGLWQGEIWNKRKSGVVFPEWLTISTILNDDGSVHRRVALFFDITEKKENEELIWRQANYDALCDLPNRRMVHDRLEQEIKKSHREKLPLALFFIDLDRFKEVNDVLGHAQGDLLLKEATARMVSCVRETDTVGRMGGDEFTIILGELDDIGIVESVASNILSKLAMPFQLGSEMAYISGSIGIAIYPDDALDSITLLKYADQAMYAAKHAGRNRFHYYTPTMQEAAQFRMRLVNDLHMALKGNQFRVHYQPIVELATGSIHKAEALLRWQHPVHGLLGPTEFISIAEETGIIIDMGDWVFREAAAQAARLRATHHQDFQISINMSPIQFRNNADNHFTWFTYLNELGLSGSGVVVEITESLLMEASDAITGQLLVFRDKGMQVALDDFGTGYSSLSYLKKFDIDYIKIDQSFVRNLSAGSNDLALCEAMIMMAHKLGLKVIAEGVETPEQRDLLAAIKCDYAQGYLFSRPLPADKFEAMVASLT